MPNPPTTWTSEDLRPHWDARLDATLALLLGESRNRIQHWIESGAVTITPAPTKIISRHKIHPKESITITPPPETEAAPEPLAEKIPLPILFEDDHLLILNKPAGLVVHPGAGNQTGTLVNALVHYCGETLARRGGSNRLGIVHRLDKETSGIMIIAKTDRAHEKISTQFQDRVVEKHYHALAWGSFRKTRGECKESIGRHPKLRQKMAIRTRGRESHTSYSILEQWPRAALVDCELHTGRTHQIRVHLSHMGHPIVGDTLYGRARKIPGLPPIERQMLHAYSIAFQHPSTRKALSFTAEPPEDFQRLLRYWRETA